MKSKEAGFCLTMRRISRLFVNTFISCTNHLSGRVIYLRLFPFFPRLESHNVRTNLLSQIFPPLTQCSNLLSLLSTQCTNHLIHFSFQSRNVRTTFHFNYKKIKKSPRVGVGVESRKHQRNYSTTSSTISDHKNTQLRLRRRRRRQQQRREAAGLGTH